MTSTRHMARAGSSIGAVAFPFKPGDLNCTLQRPVTSPGVTTINAIRASEVKEAGLARSLLQISARPASPQACMTHVLLLSASSPVCYATGGVTGGVCSSINTPASAVGLHALRAPLRANLKYRKWN